MIYSLRIISVIAVILTGIGILHAQHGVLPPKPDTSDWTKEGTNSTVITSRRLSLDQETRKAVFEENVVVVDGDLTIRADKMTVFLNASNTVETICAEGHIHATQSNRVAIARRADYDSREGKLTLTGDPKLQQGRDILKGDTITFWVADRRVVCEPNAVMITYSESESNKSSLIGTFTDE